MARLPPVPRACSVHSLHVGGLGMHRSAESITCSWQVVQQLCNSQASRYVYDGAVKLLIVQCVCID